MALWVKKKKIIQNNAGTTYIDIRVGEQLIFYNQWQAQGRYQGKGWGMVCHLPLLQGRVTKNMYFWKSTAGKHTQLEFR